MVTMLGMAEARGGAGFAGETFAQLLVVVAQQLDRDLPFEHRVEREEEDAHAALSDAVDDLVAPDGVRCFAHCGVRLGRG